MSFATPAGQRCRALRGQASTAAGADDRERCDPGFITDVAFNRCRGRNSAPVGHRCGRRAIDINVTYAGAVTGALRVD